MISLTHLSAYNDLTVYDSDEFMGLWLTEINNEAVYMLIKKNHNASYFYKDRIGNNVYKATWELEENLLSVSSLDFENLHFKLEDNLTEANPLNTKKNVSVLLKIPEEILGEWARPADYEASESVYIPSNYFGLWETQVQEKPMLIQVFKNRTVFSISKDDLNSNPQNILQGEWHKHGKLLHIVWENGSYSIIDNRDENRIKIFDFSPGEAIIERPSDYNLIKKSQKEFKKSYWSKDQKALKQNSNISLDQFNYKSLLRFYRGEWIILDETRPEALEFMKFNRFGGVDLASSIKIRGSWYLSGKECLINLEDGIRMRLKYVGSSFLIFKYAANRPLDGYPNKILRSAPLDSQKLNLLNAEVYFTSKLLEQVGQLKTKEKKGISLIPDWSDRQIINPLPSSPWWWPLWSDNRIIKGQDAFSENNSTTSLTNAIQSIASNVESERINSPDFEFFPNKSKWEWPY